MDKFLELIMKKKNELNELNALIYELDKILSKIYIDQDIIINEINDLTEEKIENKKLISKIIKFPKIKKTLKLAAIFFFTVMFSFFTFPLVYLAIAFDISIVVLLALPLDILSGFIIYKDYKQMINFCKREIEGLTIEELEQRNKEIELKKERLNSEQINSEMVISDINNRLKRYKLKRRNLYEVINFVEKVRNEIIERSCTETINSEFEIEQSKPSFQKMIKLDSK